jgi:hypothetical protein
MNRVEPYPLWLGHAGEGRDFRGVFDAGIEAVVQVAAEEQPPRPPRDLICCHFPLLDGTGNRSVLVALAIRTVATFLEMRLPTLLLCGGGVSRSPAIAAAALSLIYGKPLEDCLQEIVSHHPSDVSPGFWGEVAGVLGEFLENENKRRAEG